MKLLGKNSDVKYCYDTSGFRVCLWAGVEGSLQTLPFL